MLLGYFLSIATLLLFPTSALEANVQEAVTRPGRCFRNLGCFDITKDFVHTLYRPINFDPDDPAKIDTRFMLYTRRNVMEPHELISLDSSTIKESPYNAKQPTKFIIHGFMDNKLYGEWEEVLKSQLLLRDDMNVIIVDWSNGNVPPYTQATANTRIVGAEVAFMVTKLKELTGVDSRNIHLIGHSLGAHVAGYAGEKITNLGRITGLDPAEPYYQWMPKSVRLDPTDALFVDVIHTDGNPIIKFGLGMTQAVGHVDFYPNEGKNQPGCRLSTLTSIVTKGLIAGVRDFVACNHQRSIELFISSINYNKCFFIGYACSSWASFSSGMCLNCGDRSEKCAILGWRADEFKPFITNDSQKMYLTTEGTFPYCHHIYRVIVKLHQSMVTKEQKGKFTLHVNTRRKIRTYNVNGYLQLHPDSIYTFRIRSTVSPDEIKSVTIQWFSTPWVLRTPNIAVELVKMEHFIPPIPGKAWYLEVLTFCNGNGVIIPDQKTATFTLQDHC